MEETQLSVPSCSGGDFQSPAMFWVEKSSRSPLVDIPGEEKESERHKLLVRNPLFLFFIKSLFKESIYV